MASNDFSITDEHGDNEDWIEIYNAGGTAVDIGGMYITDDLTVMDTWQIPTTSPDSTTIQPGGYLILWADKESEEGILHVEIKLSGSGEQIGLYESDGSTVVDTLTYDAEVEGMIGYGLDTDMSCGRYPDGSDTWNVYPSSTPAATNRLPLYINEFMASNDAANTDEHGDFEDWIEIYNSGSVAIDIGGMYITDDLTATGTWQIPTTYPDSTTIQPGGFLTLWADKESEEGILHLEIKLSGSGEQIGLYESDSTTVIDTLTYDAEVEGMIGYGLDTDMSCGRFPDGTLNWVIYDGNSTPGATNTEPVAISDNGSVFAEGFSLHQNYPNPFNPETTIEYQIKSASQVTISIYNTMGQKVKEFTTQHTAPGTYNVSWNGIDQQGVSVSSGVYFYQMKANNYLATGKMLLVK